MIGVWDLRQPLAKLKAVPRIKGLKGCCVHHMGRSPLAPTGILVEKKLHTTRIIGLTCWQQVVVSTPIGTSPSSDSTAPGTATAWDPLPIPDLSRSCLAEGIAD